MQTKTPLAKISRKAKLSVLTTPNSKTIVRLTPNSKTASNSKSNGRLSPNAKTKTNSTSNSKLSVKLSPKPKQLLLDKAFKTEKEFGGALLKKSHAKKPRPISTKNAMHLTLRSSKAKGDRSFLANRQRVLLIEKKVRTQASKYGVKIYRYANVGNHLHLLIRATLRKGFIAFLRGISGIIARIALGAEKGHAKLKEDTQFWDQRPWTRILAWMMDFENVAKYVKQNFEEAMGFVLYKPRKYTSTA